MHNAGKLALTAILMASVSTGAMAAQLRTGGFGNDTGSTVAGTTNTFGAGPNKGTNIVLEAVGATATVGDIVHGGLGGIVAQQNVAVIPEAAGNFADAQALLSFTLSSGQFVDAVTATDLIAGNKIGGGTCSANAGISSGGKVGDNFVVFTVETAKDCAELRWKVPQLKNVSSSVSITGDFALSAGGAKVDNGFTNSPAPYVNLIDTNKGSAATQATVVDLASGGKVFTTAFNGSTAKAVSGIMKDVVNGDTPAANPVLPGNLAGATVNTYTELDNVATAILTISGMPAAVKALSFVEGGSATAVTFTGCATGSYVQGAGTFSCTITGGTDLNKFETPQVRVQFEVDGAQLIATSTITGKLEVDYSPATFIDKEVKFDGTIATFGPQACAAEFATIIGKNSGGGLSTIRIANTSGVDGRVFVTATNDAGVHSGVVQLVRSHLTTNPNDRGLNASELLPKGGTLEVMGTEVETATSSDFSSWGGLASRGRVRVFVEGAAGTANAGSLNANKGCVVEAYNCVGSHCSIVQPSAEGLDGANVTQQKN